MTVIRPAPARFAQRGLPTRSVTATLLVFGLCCLYGAVLPATSLGTEVFFSGPDNARLLIDGVEVGSFPFTSGIELTPTDHTIECLLDGYLPYREVLTLNARNQWLRVRVRLERLSRRSAWTMNLALAGLGQHYLDKPVKGWTFTLLEVGGLLSGLVGEMALQNYRTDYLLAKADYDQAINADELAILRREVDQTYQNMDDAQAMRDMGLLVAGGAIIISVLDAIFFFPSIETGAGGAPAASAGNGSATAANREVAFHAGVCLRF